MKNCWLPKDKSCFKKNQIIFIDTLGNTGIVLNTNCNSRFGKSIEIKPLNCNLISKIWITEEKLIKLNPGFAR